MYCECAYYITTSRSHIITYAELESKAHCVLALSAHAPVYTSSVCASSLLDHCSVRGGGRSSLVGNVILPLVLQVTDQLGLLIHLDALEVKATICAYSTPQHITSHHTTLHHITAHNQLTCTKCACVCRVQQTCTYIQIRPHSTQCSPHCNKHRICTFSENDYCGVGPTDADAGWCCHPPLGKLMSRATS